LVGWLINPSTREYTQCAKKANRQIVVPLRLACIMPGYQRTRYNWQCVIRLLRIFAKSDPIPAPNCLWLANPLTTTANIILGKAGDQVIIGFRITSGMMKVGRLHFHFNIGILSLRAGRVQRAARCVKTQIMKKVFAQFQHLPASRPGCPPSEIVHFAGIGREGARDFGKRLI